MRLYKGKNREFNRRSAILMVAAVGALMTLVPAPAAASAPANVVLGSSADKLEMNWKLATGSDAIGVEISPNGIKAADGHFVDRYYYPLEPRAEQFVTPHKFINGKYFVQIIGRATGCEECPYELSSTAWIQHGGGNSTGTPGSGTSPASPAPANATPKQSPAKKPAKRCARRSKKTKRSKRAKRAACGKKSKSKLPQLTDGFGKRS